MMSNTLKKIALFAGILFLLWFVIVLINQTAQVVDLADRVNPVFGTVVLIVLIIIYLVLAGIPIFLYFTLNEPLLIPDPADEAAHSKYVLQLRNRLKSNPYIKTAGIDMNREDSLTEASSLLHGLADVEIRRAASVVFVSTAVSQAGKLDGFLVLILVSRMLWRVMRVYNQRPTPREIVNVYVNVTGTALIAAEIGEIDIGEQLEPIIGNLMAASATGALPGLSQLSGFVANSMLDGSINAFMTLRMGEVAKHYCGSFERKPRGVVRRSASLNAGKHLALILRDSGTGVSRKLIAMGRNKFITSRWWEFWRTSVKEQNPKGTA
jgi:hypothetical protein